MLGYKEVVVLAMLLVATLGYLIERFTPERDGEDADADSGSENSE